MLSRALVGLSKRMKFTVAVRAPPRHRLLVGPPRLTESGERRGQVYAPPRRGDARNGAVLGHGLAVVTSICHSSVDYA